MGCCVFGVLVWFWYEDMKRSRDVTDDEPDTPSAEGSAASAASAAPALDRKALATKRALSELPSAEMYERSFMHRDHVTHIVVTSSDFVVTGSRDGQLKFWKKMQKGIEFVKHFKAHMASIAGMAATIDGSLLATTASDKAYKVFDVLSFDMIHWVRLDFVPGACEWLGGGSSRSRPLLAIADAEAPPIRLFDAADEGALVRTVSVHAAPVLVLRYNAPKGAVVSADARGVIEYWPVEGELAGDSSGGGSGGGGSGSSGALPGVAFRFKTETDLYAIAKAKATPSSLAISPDGEHFALCASDCRVRLYRYASGKCMRVFDEGSDATHQLQKEGDAAYRLEAFDFGRRMAVEREYRAAGAAAPPSNAIFDATGRFLLYPSIVGIKVIAIETCRLARLLGKVENLERFAMLALFQGQAQLDKSTLGSGLKIIDEADPTLFCAAFKRSRFYLFSRREPDEPEGDEQLGRDVFNEKPSKEDLALAEREARGPLPRTACINTSYGEIRLRLFPEECPKTVENFATHAANGYYDGVLFHRVIKDFMIQTGDPLGDGTGGTSIWGHEFEDEFHRSLRHDRPYTLSMANAGPGTNGSQFFITTVPAPWLDNKHTVFGRVESGIDVVQGIAKVKVNKDDKPILDIKIISVVVMHEN